MISYKVLPVKPNTEFEKKPLVISSFEDVYVINGDDENGADSLRDRNFSDSEILHFKADTKNGKLCRRVLVKFDISAIELKNVKKVSFRLYGKSQRYYNSIRLRGR